MGNQQRQGYTQGGFLGFQQGPYNQQGQWRTHPSNQFNKDQGGSSNRPIQQGPNIFQRTTKLEETLTQFMQVTMSNHKSTESTLKNLEVQMGQLAKQIADKSSNNFGANTENNPKEECKAVMTRSKRFVEAEDEENVVDKEQLSEKTGAEVKKNDVKGKENQEKGKKIMVQNKEMEDQEKEKEIEMRKMKIKIIRLQRRVEVERLWKKMWKYHIPWCLPRKKKIVIWQGFWIFSGNWK